MTTEYIKARDVRGEANTYAASITAEHERTESKRMRVRQELLAHSRSVLSPRPTDLFRKALVEGDTERARMIAELVPEFFSAPQAQELAELAKEHLPDEDEPGIREGTWADNVAGFFEAQRKLRR